MSCRNVAWMVTQPSPPPVEAGLEEEIERLTLALADVQRELRDCQESHELNLSALCAIADGIAIVDTRGRITCLNPVASHLTGWKEHASLGRSLSNVVHFTDNQGRSLNVLSEGFSSGHEDIVSLTRRDGHVILVDGSVSQIHDSGEQAIGSVVTFRNVTASTRLMRELAYQANHDSLTGLHNRRAFKAQLQRAITHAVEFGSGNAMLYIDLDEFKAVNDRGGHFAGDELLRQLAVLLSKQLREHDTVARLGGDEFAILLEHCTPAHAATVAEKIRSAIIHFEFAWSGHVFKVGASIGQIDFADGALSVQEIIGMADRMCYVAKSAGRNQVANYREHGDDTSPAGHDVSRRPGARRDDSEEL